VAEVAVQLQQLTAALAEAGNTNRPVCMADLPKPLTPLVKHARELTLTAEEVIRQCHETIANHRACQHGNKCRTDRDPAEE
jgi:hypothetical protein